MKPWYSLLRELFLGSSLGFFGWHWTRPLVVAVAIALPVNAQITVDGTTNTNLTSIDNGIRIDGGNRAEGNLFHSFSEFSVLNGTEAFFNNPNDIINIFSRVTGGNISNIDGLIRANGTANLFLLNPAGIIFGENAQLNIGGSFLSSTANSLVFADGELLATDTDNPPLLTINMPIGLNLDNNPQEIAVNGSKLQVNNGETLTLLGGEISITGGEVTASGGRVELGGVLAAGTVTLNSYGSLSFPDNVARANVSIINGATVDVSAGRGGYITVNARNLEVRKGSFLKAVIREDMSQLGTIGGNIEINVIEQIILSGEGGRRSGIISGVDPEAKGNSGDITINTGSLSLTETAFVNAISFGVGDAGDITITATDSIFLSDNSAIFSVIGPEARGKSGSITINTDSLSLMNGADIVSTTLGTGNGGAIKITATNAIFLSDENTGIGSGVGSEAKGNSGSITINTDSLSLTKEAGLFTRTFGRGDAGAITIYAASLKISDGGQINASTSIETGVAGKITIIANSLSLKKGEIISAIIGKSGEEKGANISLEISDLLTIENESLISAEALNEANGGNIDINTKFLVAFPPKDSNGNDIIANASEGQGGKIDISAQGIFGIEEREALEGNQTNDIDASSEFGLDGTVAINQPDVNSAQTLQELPTEVIDVTRLVAQNLCQQLKGSEFIITGKGGIAPNPSQVRNGEVVEVDLVEPAPFEGDRENKGNEGDEGNREEIIAEAQGWIINERGNIELVTHKTDLDGSPAQTQGDQVCNK